MKKRGKSFSSRKSGPWKVPAALTRNLDVVGTWGPEHQKPEDGEAGRGQQLRHAKTGQRATNHQEIYDVGLA